MSQEISTAHFSHNELKCRCCGANKMDKEFLIALERIRETYGSAMQLTSAFRCKAHNQASGGSKFSGHLLGKAVDIFCMDSRLRDRIFRSIVNEPAIRGYYVTPRFIHIDTKPRAHRAFFTRS